ncbi:MAG: hypothetical protein QOE29_1466 [Gaiellaceae bacterium]|nr:hypothetical protein [Gaiellaceae bacterium]
MKRTRTIGLLVVGALAVGGGIAWATIPDGGGVIHACYKNGAGDLRVIDTGAGGTCKASESPLVWSQTGPPGAAGATNVVIRTFTQTLSPGGTATFTALCSAGEVATGGGWRLVGAVPAGDPWVTVQGTVPQSSAPEPSAGETPIGWKVIGAVDHDTVDHDVTAFAVCASP